MRLSLLSILIIATTVTASATPKNPPGPYYDLCIDTARRTKLDKQAIAGCPAGDLACYCNAPLLREFMEEVETMACPGKKIDKLKVKAYRTKFNWKCVGATDFVPLVV